MKTKVERQFCKVTHKDFKRIVAKFKKLGLYIDTYDIDIHDRLHFVTIEYTKRYIDNYILNTILDTVTLNTDIVDIVKYGINIDLSYKEISLPIHKLEDSENALNLYKPTATICHCIDKTTWIRLSIRDRRFDFSNFNKNEYDEFTMKLNGYMAMRFLLNKIYNAITNTNTLGGK